MEDFEQNKVHLLKILLNNLIFFLFLKFLELFLPLKTPLPRSKTDNLTKSPFFWDTL